MTEALSRLVNNLDVVDGSKSFIEKLKKIHYRIYFENDLKINHLNYRQSILDLFEVNNTITHVRDGDPIFFNDGMSDYNFLLDAKFFHAKS